MRTVEIRIQGHAHQKRSLMRKSLENKNQVQKFFLAFSFDNLGDTETLEKQNALPLETKTFNCSFSGSKGWLNFQKQSLRFIEI